MIDNMEQDTAPGDHEVYASQGRNGYWFSSADSYGLGTSVSPVTGTGFAMTSPGYNSSYCAAVSGTIGTPSGGNYPFAGLGCNFTYPTGGYSISVSYTGVAFVINATFTGACLTPPVHFKIGDATTDPSEDYTGFSGPCLPGSVPP